ncbi:MAG: DUF1615 family protein [Myxococcota bacterium]
MALWLGWLGCVTPPPPDPGLSVEQITALVRPDVKDRAGWAYDVRAALIAAGRTPSEEDVCAVLAIVEQESGYAADPSVPGLSGIAKAEIEEQLAVLGPVSDLGKDWLLSPVPEGQTLSFEQRLGRVKTERDLDVLFREIVSYHTGDVPGLQKAGALLMPARIDGLNPIRTAGSMQVSVSWAQELGGGEGLSRDAVREALYTRAGGLRYGTARLFAHEATYDDPSYRFADYNAGLYASRNAAFQEALAKVTGMKVAPDGDLLIWNDAGRLESKQSGQTMTAALVWRATLAPDLEESRVRADLRAEKTAHFEETETWRRVRETYRGKFDADPPYARLPDVALESPKIKKKWTTAWFAQSVDKRYEACRAR